MAGYTDTHMANIEIDRLRAELALMERQRDHHAQLLDKSDAENWKLKTKLAAMTERAETAEDTVGCQADLDKDFADARAELAVSRTVEVCQRSTIAQLEAELAAKDARIAGLEAQLRHMHTFDDQHRARIAELEALGKRIGYMY